LTEGTSHGNKSGEISLNSIRYACVIIGFYSGIVSCIGDEGRGRSFYKGTLHLDHALQISLSESRMLEFLYLVALFFVLTPGVFLSLPKRASKYTVAATHAAIFLAVYYFTAKYVSSMEGFAQPARNISSWRPPSTYKPVCRTIPEVKGTCSDGRTKCVYSSECPPTQNNRRGGARGGMDSGICNGGQASYQVCN